MSVFLRLLHGAALASGVAGLLILVWTAITFVALPLQYEVIVSTDESCIQARRDLDDGYVCLYLLNLGRATVGSQSELWELSIELNEEAEIEVLPQGPGRISPVRFTKHTANFQLPILEPWSVTPLTLSAKGLDRDRVIFSSSLKGLPRPIAFDAVDRIVISRVGTPIIVLTSTLMLFAALWEYRVELATARTGWTYAKTIFTAVFGTLILWFS
jgi:hypothetical protein